MSDWENPSENLAYPPQESKQELLEKVTVWELQTQIQVLVHKLKCINMQRRRLRAQAPFIKQGLIEAEKAGTLRGMLFAEQYNKIIDDVCEE